MRISMITDKDLFQPFLYELVQYALPNSLFQKSISHNFIMFCDILSSWKWLACLSKMSILEKLKSQTGQLCDILSEWTDSRCFYYTLFWEKAWSQIEILFSFSKYELVQYAFANWLFQKNHGYNFSMISDILSPWK